MKVLLDEERKYARDAVMVNWVERDRTNKYPINLLLGFDSGTTIQGKYKATRWGSGYSMYPGFGMISDPWICQSTQLVQVMSSRGYIMVLYAQSIYSLIRTNR
jgi:hypothetical protein